MAFSKWNGSYLFSKIGEAWAYLTDTELVCWNCPNCFWDRGGVGVPFRRLLKRRAKVFMKNRSDGPEFINSSGEYVFNYECARCGNLYRVVFSVGIWGNKSKPEEE